jgi:hypothetical protein
VLPCNRTKLLRANLLPTIIVAGVDLLGSGGLPRMNPVKDQIPWKETLTPAAKGIRIAVPSSILTQVKANPDDCLNPSQEEATKMDAYKLRKGNFLLIAIRGRSSCFCGATGNCAFWLYRYRRGTYERLLETDMVRDFGFLRSTTSGLPDLVLWSHDSADRSPGALWRFNGREYDSECSWEIVTSFRDVPNGIAEPIESHVENSTCHQKITPETELFQKN